MKSFVLLPVTVLVFTIWTTAQSQQSPAPCMSCEELQKADLPDVFNLQTDTVHEGSVYCKLTGTISREINFELLLPQQWNQRFVMGGGGGFVGSIQNVARSKVHEGYATVGTDTGHKGPGIKADWAHNNMERQLNYGYLAVHRTAEVARALIRLYYCEDPEYSYFIGCSRGGGQAMHEAQRYPDDFDGIVAAAPVISFTATGAEFIQNIQVLYPDPEQLKEAVISENHLALLQEAILDQCDILDGLTDRIINDPRDCHFDYSRLPRCTSEEDTGSCFTQAQIRAIQAIYAGASDGRHQIYPGFPVGCENEPGAWKSWIVGPEPGIQQFNFPSLHFAFGTELFKYLVLNDPDWNYAKYDFANFERDTRYAAAYLDATSVDYSGFRDRGGKIIFTHGWNDPALSAYSTIEHYESVRKNHGQVDDFMRLFLLPGVLHCGGGPGPGDANWLEIVRDWVENGNAPHKVVVTKSKDGEVIMSRPVFPYPSTTRFIGGDPNRESSFVEKSNE
jgi:pimeloyl-ACP methyl ester carboxylesterase